MQQALYNETNPVVQLSSDCISLYIHTHIYKIILLINPSPIHKQSEPCICEDHRSLLNKQYRQDLGSPHFDKATFENTCSLSVVGGRSLSSLCLKRSNQENVLAPVCDSQNIQEYLYSFPTSMLKAVQEEVSIVFQ